MKIGLCFDTKEDYGFASGNLDYTDFVSIATIAEIAKALELCGYDVVRVGNIDKLKALLASGDDDIDLFFNVAEGFSSRNREALIPALLEAYKRPFTASDAYAMAITLHKHQTNLLLESIGIPSPKGIMFKTLTKSVIEEISNVLGFPVVIKPNAEGGSMGLCLASNIQEVKDHIENSSMISGEWLAEEYIEGIEVTVPIIGNAKSARALGVVATLHEDGTNIDLYDSELKYIDNVINTLEFSCSVKTREQILQYSVEVHRYFSLNDYSRMDFRIDISGKPFFLEANLMPSLCRDGSFEVCGKIHGLSYQEVIQSIVEAACTRQGIAPNL